MQNAHLYSKNRVGDVFKIFSHLGCLLLHHLKLTYIDRIEILMLVLRDDFAGSIYFYDR
jgi:hypothetical protein